MSIISTSKQSSSHRTSRGSHGTVPPGLRQHFTVPSKGIFLMRFVVVVFWGTKGGVELGSEVVVPERKAQATVSRTSRNIARIWSQAACKGRISNAMFY